MAQITIELQKSSTTLIRTTTEVITYTVKVDGEPIEAVDSKMTATPTDGSKATYDVTSKTLSAKGTGATTILFQYNHNGELGTAVLSVNVLALMEFKINQESVKLKRNTTSSLTCVITKDGEESPETDYTFEIESGGFFTYSKDDKLIRGVKTGNSNIIFKANDGVKDISKTIPVTVDPIYRLEVNKERTSIKTGTEDNIYHTLYKDDQVVEGNDGVTHKVGSELVFTYNKESKKIRGVKYGNSTLTFEYQTDYEKLTKVVDITIKPIYTIESTPSVVKVYNNETAKIDYLVKADGDPKPELDVNVRVINDSICTYSKDTKIVTPKAKEGTTKINFRYTDDESTTCESNTTVTVLPVYSIWVEKTAVSIINNSRQSILYELRKDGVKLEPSVAVPTVSSTEDSIATYNLDRQEITTGNPGTAKITFSYNDGTKTVENQITVNVVSEFMIVPTPSSVIVETNSTLGLSYMLTKNGVEIEPDNPEYGEITYHVEDDTICDYNNETKMVSGIRIGDTTITFTHSSGSKTEVPVKVIPKYTIELDSETYVVKRNSKIAITSTLKADGEPVDGQQLTYTINNTQIATYADGFITGKTAGQTSITVSVNGDSFSASASANIVVRSLITLAFNPKTVNLSVNETKRNELNLLVDNVDMTSYATIESDDDTMATYDPNKKEVTSYSKYGSTTIKAKYNDGYEDYEDTLNVNVIKNYSILLSNINPNLKNGETLFLDWSVTLDGTTTSETVDTRVENSDICTYDKTSKLITAKKAGSTKIIFTHSSGVSTEANVTVRPIYNLEVSKNLIVVKVGEEADLTYTLKADGVIDNENKDQVVISSLDPTIASYSKTSSKVSGSRIGGTSIIFSFSDGYETLVQYVTISVNPANMENATFISLESTLDNNMNTGIDKGKSFNYLEKASYNPTINSQTEVVLEIDFDQNTYKEDSIIVSQHSYLNGISAPWVMPIVREIKITGDANKYYPVVFKGQNSSIYTDGIPMQFTISKYVHTSGTSDNDGSMILQFTVNESAWGGNKTTLTINSFGSTNKEFVSDVRNIGSSAYSIVVWLRGGNRTYKIVGPIETDDIKIYYERTNIGSSSNAQYVEPLSIVNNIVFKKDSAQVGYLKEVMNENKFFTDAVFYSRGLYITGNNPTIVFGQKDGNGSDKMQGLIRYNNSTAQLEISGGSTGKISFGSTTTTSSGSTHNEYGKWSSTELRSKTNIVGEKDVSGNTLKSTGGIIYLGSYSMRVVKS